MRKRKTIALLVAVVLIMTLLPVTVLAVNGEQSQKVTGSTQGETALEQDVGQSTETAAPTNAEDVQPTEMQQPEQSAASELDAEQTVQPSAEASKEAKQTEASAETLSEPDLLSITPLVQEEGSDGITDITDLSQITTSGSYRLIQDTTLQRELVIGADINVTIDLNGHTITSTGANFFVNEGVMRVYDSAGGGGVSAPRGCIYNKGTVSISGGHYITTDNTGGSALYNSSGATMVIEYCVVNAVSFAIGNSGNCTINGGEFHSTSSNATPNWAYCIKSTGEGARLTINNATVTGIQGGVAAVQGTVEIYGGDFSTEQGNSRSFYALYVAGENGEVSGDVYGGNFSSPKRAVYIGNDNTNGDGGINASACLNIHGGTFDGGASALFKAQNTGTAFISGGTFRDGTGDSSIDKYVLDGYAVVENEDGSVSVKMFVKNETTGKGYKTLQAACAELKDGDTLVLGEGTFTATANEQFRITASDVTIQGQGDATIIDCGAYSVSGQGGMLVQGDNVTIEDMKIVSNSTNGTVNTLKFTAIGDGSSLSLLSGVVIRNVTLSSMKGNALNLHGVQNAVVNGVTVEQTGKCGIALASADGVTISNTKTSASGWNCDIGIMYAQDNAAYATPTRLTLGSGNTFANKFIYSERPTNASGGVDTITGYEGTELEMIVANDGTWQLMVVPVSSIRLNKTSLTLEMNTKGHLFATVLPANVYDKSITWNSSNPSIVKVDKGTLTPVAPGTATITATSSNGKSASCTVTVSAPPETPRDVAPNLGDKIPIIVEPEINDKTIDSEVVKDAITNVMPDEAVVVKVTVQNEDDAQDITVNADVIAAAAKAAMEGTGAKTLSFSVTDADGNIISAITLDLSNGVDPDKLKDINLGHSNMVSSSVAKTAMAGVPQGAKVLFINLTHEGTFPCPITRMDQMDSSFQPGDTVYLYYIGSTGLSEEQVLRVDANGYITYTITHASPYVVSNLRSIAASPEQPGSETPDTNTDGTVKVISNTKVVSNTIVRTTAAPKTDDIQDVALYLWLIVIADGAIVASVVLTKKSRKKS